jgi:hypothetical protein
LIMVEKWGWTLFVSMLTNVLWDRPVVFASCAWVMNLCRLAVFTFSPILTGTIIGNRIFPQAPSGSDREYLLAYCLICAQIFLANFYNIAYNVAVKSAKALT